MTVEARRRFEEMDPMDRPSLSAMLGCLDEALGGRLEVLARVAVVRREVGTTAMAITRLWNENCS